MISYFVLTPPGGADRDHRSTLFVADKFAWWALFFPWIWLLGRRLWLAAFVAFACETGAGMLMQQPGLWWAGVLAGFALHALVALEGRHLYISHLVAKGWAAVDLVTAPDLSTAEEMFFSGLPAPVQPLLPNAGEWAKANPSKPSGWSAPALGLFDQTGAR